MNSLRPRPLPLLSSRLLFGNSNGPVQTTAIAGGMRYSSTEAAAASTAATTPAASTVPVPTPQAKTTEKHDKAKLKADHGERVWVHNHIVDNFTLYSLKPELDSNKAFRQLSYTGKKLIPAKLRKDYWRLLAVVEFGPGRGDVGRSAFQKLRELRKRHLLEWEDEALLRMTRRERGQALNDQRGNSVADMAAVLAGVGKGNRVLFDPEAEQQKQQQQQRGARKQQQKKNVAVKDLGDEGVVEVKKVGEKGEETVKLHQATVYWANEQDKYYAESWTENVTHVIGLPEKVRKAEMVEEAEPVAETSQAEGEAAKAE